VIRKKGIGVKKFPIKGWSENRDFRYPDIKIPSAIHVIKISFIKNRNV
jgi:hypothetical protein